MNVIELHAQLEQIIKEGGGKCTVFYTRPSDICRLGADENIVEAVYYSGMQTEGHSEGVQLS